MSLSSQPQFPVWRFISLLHIFSSDALQLLAEVAQKRLISRLFVRFFRSLTFKMLSSVLIVKLPNLELMIGWILTRIIRESSDSPPTYKSANGSNNNFFTPKTWTIFIFWRSSVLRLTRQILVVMVDGCRLDNKCFRME